MAYDAPDPAALKARYPAFHRRRTTTIQYWLTDAQRYVDTTWIEGDYAPALIAHAAYDMARVSVPGLTGSDEASLVAAGITDFQSASVRLRFSDEAVKAAVAGGYGSNIYGIEYYALLRRNKAGPARRRRRLSGLASTTASTAAPGPLPQWYPYG
jgi:hypothetical protein